MKSWGNYPKQTPKATHVVASASDLTKISQPMLAYGNGRSYGDSCLNEKGQLLCTKALNHFLDFDEKTGLLKCEAGVLLSDILRTLIPKGWMLPVVPGTQFVTVGGAIANDVHGKNHHLTGTFGLHVKQFELQQSNGERILCSPKTHKDLFEATIGGLGLTGLITWAEIQLQPLKSEYLDVETIPFDNLSRFFELSKSSEKDYEFTVAWLDCQSQGRAFGRGLFMRANYLPKDQTIGLKKPALKRKRIPFNFPSFALNKLSISLFNMLYYFNGKRKAGKSIQHYQPFFFPLDSILEWNKIYGKNGFMQYQFVLPMAESEAGLEKVLKRITASGQGSFLAVLKVFGHKSSPGMLSFPQEGVTLALDFANRGKKTLALLEDLDVLVREHGGRVYPAKDARMSSTSFKQYYPNWTEFKQYKDPKFSSSLWRRVTQKEQPHVNKKALIIGATSAIAQAAAQKWAEQNYDLVLVGRNKEKLAAAVTDLKVRSSGEVTTIEADMNDLEQHEKWLKQAWPEKSQLDVVLIAHGTLSDQEKCEKDISETLKELNTNAISVISLLTHLGNRFEAQGSGHIAVISSVAGDRGRQSNYVYGTAKAAVTTFMQGLRNRLTKSGVNVLTIKPGFVDTPMTQDLKKGKLWTQPEKVADDIIKAIEKQKSVIYTPWFWGGIMWIIKHIPERVFKKLSL